MNIDTTARLRLDSITLDGDLQPRAEIDLATVQEYAQLMADGHAFPPLVVFADGANNWLADGFHRYHALRSLRHEDCECVTHVGTKAEAVTFSLHANAGHGKQRVAADYRKAYEIGCRYELFDAASSKAVAASLGCSLRWADKLTERARADAEEERRKLVAMMKAEEKSNRQISAETGIPHATVDRIVSASKANSAEMRQPEPPGIFDDRRQAFAAEEAGQHLADTDRTRQVLAESKARTDVLYPVGRALEAFASLPDVDAVIAADPSRRWSDINEFLPLARKWINSLSEKWNV